MASIGLRGQNEYAYCTTNSILWGVFETKFCFKSYGLGVKVEHTDRQTVFGFIYIDSIIEYIAVSICRLRTCFLPP